MDETNGEDMSLITDHPFIGPDVRPENEFWPERLMQIACSYGLDGRVVTEFFSDKERTRKFGEKGVSDIGQIAHNDA